MLAAIAATFLDELDLFLFLVDHLPQQVPLKTPDESAFSDFFADSFVPDQEHLEMSGDVCSTISEHLKRVFGWQARTTEDGLIPKLERGPGLKAVHRVLLEYHQQHPNNDLMRHVLCLLLAAPNY